jgi:hypothetical protein
MKRQRGRGRKPNNSGNRSLESNGPEVKIRGSASQIYEKYVQYARDAQTSGDRIKAENYLQHAEHYYRIMAANMPKDRPQNLQRNEEQSENVDGAPAETTENADAESSEDALKVVDASEEEQQDGEVAASAEDGQEEDAQPKRQRRPRRRKPIESNDAQPDAEAKSALESLAADQADLG